MVAKAKWLLLAWLGFFSTAVRADETPWIGAPKPWQMNLIDAAAPLKVELNRFHDMLLVIIFAITAFVTLLLIYVMIRFRAKANPVPSTRTHHTGLEIAWTTIPVLILVAIAFPSFKLMYYMDKAKQPELTLKVTGHQWYWGYEYPDLGIDEYASNMIADDKLKPTQIRLLSVDNPVVLPVDTEVQILINGADVIHSWAVPSFAINRSAMPGRTNESWVKITHEGVYYGQCTKICGINHAYMPIEVRAVSKEKFQAWAAAAKANGVDKANATILGLNTTGPASSLASSK